ncbi:unnamed protein product, partial [Adineta steineri]
GDSYEKTSEVYDLLTGTWSMTDDMNCARYQHQSSILSNGTVLVTGAIGGISSCNAELY